MLMRVSWQYKQKEERPQFPDVLDCMSQSNHEPDLKRVCINSDTISGKTKCGLTRQKSDNTTMQKTKINMQTYYLLLLLSNTVL